MPSAVLDKKQGMYVIPAQHINRLREFVSGEQEMPVSLERIVQQVFSADYAFVFDIPASKIHKFANSDKATRLVLCSNYDPSDPIGSCPLGERCKFVHADVRDVATKTVHTNYAWNSLTDVTYERFAPGKTFRVAAPSSKTITDVLDSQAVLKTKALTSQRRPLSHCAHYYFNRTCNLGSDCQFIHAIYIDPEAKPHQRAPAPTQLGRPMRGTPMLTGADPEDEPCPQQVDHESCQPPSPVPTPSKASLSLLLAPVTGESRMRQSCSVSFMTPTVIAPPVEPSSDSDPYATPCAFESGMTKESPTVMPDPLAAAMLGRATPVLSPSMLQTPSLTPRKTPDLTPRKTPEMNAMQSPESRNNSMFRGLPSWQTETHLSVNPDSFTLSPSYHAQLASSTASTNNNNNPYDGNNNSRGTPYRHNPYGSRATPTGAMPPSPLSQVA